MSDLSITAANVLYASGDKQGGIAGETITAGQALYLKASDGKLWKAQADGTAAEATAVGIALHAALANQPVTYAGNGCTLNIGGTTSKATVYVVSAAAGGIAPLADLTSTQYISHLGYATATDGSMVLKITNTGVVV